MFGRLTCLLADVGNHFPSDVRQRLGDMLIIVIEGSDEAATASRALFDQKDFKDRVVVITGLSSDPNVIARVKEVLSHNGLTMQSVVALFGELLGSLGSAEGILRIMSDFREDYDFRGQISPNHYATVSAKLLTTLQRCLY